MKISNFSLISTLFILVLVGTSCYRMRPPGGGGQIKDIPPRTINTDDIALYPGYKIESVLTGLTYPTAIAFDSNETMYIVEAGYSYGEKWEIPRLLRYADDSLTTIASGEKNGPWTGIAYQSGAFYIAEGGALSGGRILKVMHDGTVTALVSDLPSVGDHHTNGPVIHNGYIYFGQGVATNSGIVGTDNAEFGWLQRQKTFHDIPCADVKLTGENYQTPNVLTDDPDDQTSTGAFVPFGTATTAGQIIKGAVPCSGSVLRIPLGGGQIELVGWGFRNPFGLAVFNDKIYVTDNGYDERGSRPVWGTGDILWELQENTWYGWPDFSAGTPLNKHKEFKAPKADPVKPLLAEYPNTPPKPKAILGVHSSSNGLDFSQNAGFGFEGDAFIAQFGDMSGAGKVLAPVGFKIVKVDVETGVIRDFATNKGSKNGPASWLGSGGLERPVSVKFSPSGDALYIVDFGIMKTTDAGIEPIVKTGTIWKVTKQ